MRDFRPGPIGKLLWHLLPIRRGIIMEGITQAFGSEMDADGLRRLAQCYYEHIVRSIHEIFAFFASSEKLLRRKVRIEGKENLIEAAKRNKGILILTGHFGNWETAPLAALLHFPEYYGRFHFVRTALFSRALERLLFRRYRDYGLGVIPKQDALPQVLDALARNDAVVFVLDQHIGISRRLGIPVPFFGRKAGTHRSLALVARSTGAPVVPATSYREKSGNHVVRFDPPLEWISCPDPEEEIYRNTRRYNEVLENLVREHPEQYFWVHRRYRIRDDAVPRKSVPAGLGGKERT